MGVPLPHFLLEPRHDRSGAKRPSLFAENDLKREIEQQIAQFTLEVVVVARPNGVHDLVGFLEKMWDQRLRSLASFAVSVTTTAINGTIGP